METLETDRSIKSSMSVELECKKTQTNQRKLIHESWIIATNCVIAIRFVFLFYQLIFTYWYYFIFQFENPLKKYKYWTFWGSTFATVYFLLIQIEWLRRCCSKDKQKYTSMWRLITIVFEVGFVTEVAIFLLFWVILFPGLQQNYMTFDQIFGNYNLHGIFPLSLILELFYNHIEFFKKDFQIILFMNTLYFLVNFIFQFALDTQVYNMFFQGNYMTIVYFAVINFIAIIFFAIGYHYYQQCKKKRMVIKERHRIDLKV